MSEQNPQSSASFDEEAAARSRRFFDEVKSLGQPYRERETLGDLVIDGTFHPYVFLERNHATRLWIKAKGLLMTIYKDYKEAKGLRPNEKWGSPLTRPTFNSEKYSELSEETRSLIEEYIEYLMQSETATKPFDAGAYGLNEPPIGAEIPVLPTATGRHAADEPVSVDNL